AMSIYGIIACCVGGVSTGIFNAMLSGAGYVAPEVVDGVTRAAEQSQAVKDVITFAFVGLETITGVVLAALLIFLSVEKTIARKQEMIRQRQKADCEARGEEWIAPEVKAALDEQRFLAESEEIFAKELKEKCQKKGLDFEKELSAHQQTVAENSAKQQAKKQAAEQKAAEKAQKAEQKRNAKLAKLSAEKLAKKQAKAKAKAEKENALWQQELQKGEIYFAKIQAELAAKQK
ncbi:MAG: MFS transporter, partial [Candidatus Fimimonas sp.]